MSKNVTRPLRAIAILMPVVYLVCYFADGAFYKLNDFIRFQGLWFYAVLLVIGIIVWVGKREKRLFFVALITGIIFLIMTIFLIHGFPGKENCPPGHWIGETNYCTY